MPQSEFDPHSRDISTSRPPLDPHLKALENEAIHIFREVAGEFERPVMLYSVGKDSSVLLHLARKAFYPGRVPFPLLHVNTGWKFKEMIEFRDKIVAEYDLDLIAHTNPRGALENVTPFSHGSALYTDIMKTEALKQALDAGKYDAAFGGARRDEEASRAKERIYSFRTPDHKWDPRNQRPELWNIYNGQIRQGESVRAFPLSNWTEVDIWRYIQAENIPIVPLYFAEERPIVERDGMMILAEDERLELLPGEVKRQELIRFRTLGCFPLTGAIRSTATTLDEIIDELETATVSERQGRAIDRDQSGSMEKKKREGYF
ncbi:MAG: sulfate adenylyltransferase subunit 2 [Rhizobium sp.]|nr:sulfate adenylyltransferase subunit 2 [Rhizobium sp.]